MAGEIQLNSTTMATESSGSITAELDTIRPNTTNGSLTLQGDSGGSGVSGITIDSSGNATFAGTISGGTLGSSVVFPSGHIIQTVRNTKSGNSTSTTSTTFAKVQNSLSEYYYATINNVLVNSKVFITTRFHGRFDKTANNAGGEFGLYRDSTIILGQSTLSNPVNYYLHVGVTDTDYWIPQTIIFLDESPTTGTNNYYLGYSSYGSTSVQVLGYINFEMILMEIAE